MTDQSAPPAPPQPTQEHKRLAEHVGVWNVECEFNMGPDQPQMKTNATEKVEMFGGFWTTSVFKSEMFGAPYEGRCTVGFDPKQNLYVSTWVDTMSPALFVFTGKYDASGKTLEMSGEGPDCMGGGMASYRTTEQHVSRDERIFEMFMTSPGQPEMKLFRHHYKRAK